MFGLYYNIPIIITLVTFCNASNVNNNTTVLNKHNKKQIDINNKLTKDRNKITNKQIINNYLKQEQEEKSKRYRELNKLVGSELSVPIEFKMEQDSQYTRSGVKKTSI